MQGETFQKAPIDFEKSPPKNDLSKVPVTVERALIDLFLTLSKYDFRAGPQKMIPFFFLNL